MYICTIHYIHTYILRILLSSTFYFILPNALRGVLLLLSLLLLLHTTDCPCTECKKTFSSHPKASELILTLPALFTLCITNKLRDYFLTQKKKKRKKKPSQKNCPSDCRRISWRTGLHRFVIKFLENWSDSPNQENQEELHQLIWSFLAPFPPLPTPPSTIHTRNPSYCRTRFVRDTKEKKKKKSSFYFFIFYFYFNYLHF